MHRRAAIVGALSSTALFALPAWLRASQQCGPIMPTPIQTPFGPQLRNLQMCTAGIATFSFAQALQQMSEWCWAASISMVFNYYGHPISQQRIVAETWGGIGNVPAQPGVILQDLNRPWRDDDGNSFQVQGDVLSVSPQTAVLDLQQDHPLIIGALGHATVLTALTSRVDVNTGQWEIVSAIVRDPWPGNGGRRVLSPQEWANIQFAVRIRTA